MATTGTSDPYEAACGMGIAKLSLIAASRDHLSSRAAVSKHLHLLGWMILLLFMCPLFLGIQFSVFFLHRLHIMTTDPYQEPLLYIRLILKLCWSLLEICLRFYSRFSKGCKADSADDFVRLMLHDDLELSAESIEMGYHLGVCLNNIGQFLVRLGEKDRAVKLFTAAYTRGLPGAAFNLALVERGDSAKSERLLCFAASCEDENARKELCGLLLECRDLVKFEQLVRKVLETCAEKGVQTCGFLGGLHVLRDISYSCELSSELVATGVALLQQSWSVAGWAGALSLGIHLLLLDRAEGVAELLRLDCFPSEVRPVLGAVLSLKETLMAGMSTGEGEALHRAHGLLSDVSVALSKLPFDQEHWLCQKVELLKVCKRAESFRSTSEYLLAFALQFKVFRDALNEDASRRILEREMALQVDIYLLTFDKGSNDFNVILRTCPDLEPFRKELREADLPLEIPYGPLENVKFFVPPCLFLAAMVLLQKHKDEKEIVKFYSRHVVVSESSKEFVMNSLGKLGKLKKGAPEGGDFFLGTAKYRDMCEGSSPNQGFCLWEACFDLRGTFLVDRRRLEKVTTSTILGCNSVIKSSYVNPRRRVVVLPDRVLARSDRGQISDDAVSYASTYDSFK